MQERRQFKRFLRRDTVMFSLKDSSHASHDQSRLVDISKGGLKFFALKNYPVGTKIVFEIKFIFLSPRGTLLEGEVIHVQRVFEGNIYKTGVKFSNLSPESLSALEQMEKLTAP